MHRLRGADPCCSGKTGTAVTVNLTCFCKCRLDRYSRSAGFVREGSNCAEKEEGVGAKGLEASSLLLVAIPLQAKAPI